MARIKCSIEEEAIAPFHLLLMHLP